MNDSECALGIYDARDALLQRGPLSDCLTLRLLLFTPPEQREGRASHWVDFLM